MSYTLYYMHSELHAKFIIDATELGDVAKMVGIKT